MNIYAKRLLNVARALRESPNPDKFTMTSVIHNCGAPACAFGHYAARTDLQDAFRPIRASIGRGFVYGVEAAQADECGRHEFACFDGDLVNAHFGLSETENSELFSGYGCGHARTALQAAAYIEAFVARKYPAAPITYPNWRAIASHWTVSDSVRDNGLDFAEEVR